MLKITSSNALPFYSLADNAFFERLSVNSLEKILYLEHKAMVTDTTYPLSREDLSQAFERDDAFYGLFFQGTLIAKVGFTREPNERYEFDIMIHPDYQGRGLGRKLMRLSISELSSRLPKASIYLKVHPNNERGRLLYTSENFIESQRIETDHGPRIIMNWVKPTSF